MLAHTLPDALRAATESRRLQILELIWEQERSVSDIASHLPVSVPAVSQHLAKLRKADLVDVRAEGRKRFYRARRDRLGPLEAILGAGQSSNSGGPDEVGASSQTPEAVSPYGLPRLASPPSRPEQLPTPAAPNAPEVPFFVPKNEGLDEMGPWYRQGLRGRVVALEAARTSRDGAPMAGQSIRRIAQSLTRPAIAHRFEEIGAIATEVAGLRAEVAGEAVERLMGAIRRASVHDDAAVVKILLVEDSPIDAVLHGSIISGPNREILTAATAEEAQRLVAAEPIDLIVLDLTLPGADGRDLLMDLRRRPSTATIPVILLTGRSDAQTRTETMALGADAYYAKPVEPTVLAAGVSMMLERAAEARQVGRRDPLTGLRNRAVFLEDVRQLAGTAVRANVDLALAILEVERLGSINDFHGNEAGDTVLRSLADSLRGTFRDSDLVARWSGGKFAVLFTHAGPEGAHVALQKLREVTDARVVALGDETELTVAWHAGIASISGTAGLDDAVARATRRLQIASRGASGRVVSVDAAVIEGARTVLLVEDDEILGDLIEHRLSREGFEVARFADGAEVLGAMAGVDASAVILDTMLPGAEGFEVLRRLKGSPSFAGVPVVVLTFGSDHDTARAFKLGASDSLAKPFSVEELVARVARLVAESEEIPR